MARKKRIQIDAIIPRMKEIFQHQHHHHSSQQSAFLFQLSTSVSIHSFDQVSLTSYTSSTYLTVNLKLTTHSLQNGSHRRRRFPRFRLHGLCPGDPQQRWRQERRPRQRAAVHHRRLHFGRRLPIGLLR